MQRRRANTSDSEVEFDLLSFLTNIEMFEDLHNFNFEKIIGAIFLC